MERLKQFFSTPLGRRAPFYFAEAIVVVALLYLFGLFASKLPAVLVAVIWALASAASAVAFAYPFIVKKLNTREMFQDGSRVSRRVNGRVFRLVCCYVLSMVLTASLMVESQKWEPAEWAVVWISIPLYFLVSMVLGKAIIAKEYKPVYQRRATMLWSWVITSIVVTAALVAATVVSAARNPLTVGEAFSSTRLLFADSSSVLLEEAGKIGYLVDGFMASGLSQISALAFGVYLAVTVVFCASSAFALAHLLSLCSLEPVELKRVFLPVGEAGNVKLRSFTIKKTVAALVVMALVATGAFMGGERIAAEEQQSEGYTAVTSFVRDQAHIVTYEFDGKVFDRDTVRKTVEELVDSNDGLTEKRNELVTVVSDAYDVCISNIDTYLDEAYPPWYESVKDGIQDGLDKIRSMISGSDGDDEEVEPGYREIITEGVDMDEVKSSIQAYNQALEDLISQTKDKLSSMQSYDIPNWLIAEEYPLEDFFQASTLDAELTLNEPQGSYTDKEARRKAILQSLEDARSEMLEKIL